MNLLPPLVKIIQVFCRPKNSVNPLANCRTTILFSSPKPRRADNETVQRAAFHSWRRAFPQARILLFGDTDSWRDDMAAQGMEAGGSLAPAEGGVDDFTTLVRTTKRRLRQAT